MAASKIRYFYGIDSVTGEHLSAMVELWWPTEYRRIGGKNKRSVSYSYNKLINDSNYTRLNVIGDIEAPGSPAAARLVWNVYMAYYNPAYYVCGERIPAYSLEYTEYMPHVHIDDPARAIMIGIYDQLFLDDYSAYADSVSAGHTKPFVTWLEHRRLFGTNNYGNLPENKSFLYVGSCHNPCPYSTQASEERTRVMLDLGSGSVASPIPLPTRTDHGNYYMDMIKVERGYGYVCTYPACPGKSGSKPYVYA